VFWADTVLSLVRDDNDEPHSLVAVERDITQLKQAEEEFQKRATRLELIQRVSQMMTAILELDPLLHKTVELIGDTFGYYSTQILLVEGSELVVTATTHPLLKSQEGRLRLRVGSEGITGEVAASGEPLLVPDVRQDRRFWFTEEMKETRSELAVPIKLMDRVIGVLDIQDTEPMAFGQEDLSTLQTIADQAAIAIENARLYEANQRYTQGLHDLVAEQTADVQAVNEQLLALSRVKDEFVSNVSHELRTPIASLQLYLGLLARFPEKTSTYLDTLQRETDRLEHIIDGLLELSRLDQGQVGASMLTVDLNELVHLSVADRPLLAESRGLRLTLEMQPDLPPTTADSKLIGQALSILLTNAFNYTPAGGWVKVATRTLTAKEQQWVGFTVSDSGPGISHEEQSRIFDRFFRGEAGRVSGVPGTGLGLAIVKEIVERHQGWVEVESEGAIGKGASFGVWLPTEGKTSDAGMQNSMDSAVGNEGEMPLL
jgi:signal transduction histidine kinase